MVNRVILGKLEDIEDEFLHFDSVRLFRLADAPCRIHVRDLLFGNVMLQHFLLSADYGAQEVDTEEVIANVSSVEGQASVRVALLSGSQSDLAILDNLGKEGESLILYFLRIEILLNLLDSDLVLYKRLRPLPWGRLFQPL